MAHWQRKLRIKSEWTRCREGEMTRQELANVIANRLEKLSPLKEPHSDINEQRDDLVYEFRSLASDPDASEDDFNEIMTQLYDWADTKISGEFFDAKKVCWIETF